MPGATTTCSPSRAPAARRRRVEPLRARLDRHLDRRIPLGRVRSRRAASPRSRASSRARSSSPTRSMPIAELAPLSARAAGGDAACRATCSTARPPSAGSPAIFGVATTGGLRRALARSSSPRRRPRSPMSSARSSASGRRCRRRCARRRATLLIDAATRSNLELVRTLAGERRGSLLAAIDRTRHRGRLAAAGAAARGAAHRSAAPSHARHDAVEFFVERRGGARRPSRAARSGARSCARAGAAGGRPRRAARSRRHPRRHLAAAALADELRCRRPAMPDGAGAGDRRAAPPRPARCRASSRRALADELPHLKRDGGFVRAGYDAALDEARALRDESRRVIAALAGALRRRRPACAR